MKGIAIAAFAATLALGAGAAVAQDKKFISIGTGAESQCRREGGNCDSLHASSFHSVFDARCRTSLFAKCADVPINREAYPSTAAMFS